MKTDVIFGAEGMHKFLAALRYPSGRREELRFPSAAEWIGVEFACEETKPRDFFIRLINSAAASGMTNHTAAIESCQLDEGIAVFMDIKWKGIRLLQCSVQIVVAPESDLESLYSEEDRQGIYYRFDYSVEERGHLFNHPFPHVHSVPEGAPRFHFPMNTRIFAPFSILEFVMINHRYENWREWLLKEYASHHHGVVSNNECTPEEFFEAYKDEANWLRIDENQRIEFLRRLKRASRLAIERLSERYPKIDSDYFSLNYWQ